MRWTQQVVFIDAYAYMHLCIYVTTVIEELTNLTGSGVLRGGVRRGEEKSCEYSYSCVKFSRD